MSHDKCFHQQENVYWRIPCDQNQLKLTHEKVFTKFKFNSNGGIG
jgi:hypothetical protein